MQIPQLDPIRPAGPFQLPSSRFDGSTGPRIIGPRDGKFNEVGEQMAAANAVSMAAVPDLAGLGARYGHYFQPESIARLCRQHGLVYPA